MLDRDGALEDAKASIADEVMALVSDIVSGMGLWPDSVSLWLSSINQPQLQNAFCGGREETGSDTCFLGGLIK